MRYRILICPVFDTWILWKSFDLLLLPASHTRVVQSTLLFQNNKFTKMSKNPPQNTSNEEVFILIVNWNILKKYQD